MANERTFLAWIRTSIGIMAFGFVVERFALFVKQIAHFLERSNLTSTDRPQLQPLSGPDSMPRGYSSLLGIFLVGLGTILVLAAYIRFRTVEKQIDEHSYRSPSALTLIVTVSVVAVGVLLLIYLTNSI